MPWSRRRDHHDTASASDTPAYAPHDLSQTLLYRVVADHLETFLASLDTDPDARGLPAYVKREFYDYLQCGALAYDFLRLGCDTCHQELLLAFSCKRRGFCPSVQPGLVTFIQRFSSAINVNLHFHCIFLEGVCLDRTEAHLKPRFVRGEPPTDADITTVVQKISRRIIRKLRHLGYLEVGLDAPAATGYDPWRDDALELARTMAASVQQRLAFGERAGERVRRIGASFGVDGEVPALTGPRCASVQGFSLHANTHVPAHRRTQLERLIRYTARGAVSLECLTQDVNGDLIYTFTHPWSDGTTGIRLSPMELLEKLAALVPLPHVHLVRYGGCLAPHSHLRGSVIPTLRQQGLEEQEATITSPQWSWARLLHRVFALDMVHCPWCQRGTLRLIAVITQGEVIRKILRHLKRSVDPPPITPARARQTPFDWVA